MTESNDINVVNVASIPQRSPFRYPGGKTWLVPQVRLWLKSLSNRPRILVEPFVGGGIISLTAAFENLVDHVIMVEIDLDVAAVWRCILGSDGPWLAEKITDFRMSPESVSEELARSPTDIKERAFQTILRNRTSHGGILAPGSGVIKRGENGKGIGSRWYPATLRRRILDIMHIKDKITFIQGDGLKVVNCHLSDPDAVFFLDPPYTAGNHGKRAGRRLYAHNSIDHQQLFHLAGSAAGDILMTYDYDEHVIKLAKTQGFSLCPIRMKNTHNATMQELLIGRDLAWAGLATLYSTKSQLQLIDA